MDKTKFLKRCKARRKKSRAYASNYHSLAKWLMREIKAHTGCEVCGYNSCIRSLQFHHINPEEKALTLSRGCFSAMEALREISKCVVVCSNCHAEIHEDAYWCGHNF